MVIGNLKGKSEQGEAYFGQLNLAEFCAYLINNTNAEKLVALVPPTKLDLLDGSYNKIKVSFDNYLFKWGIRFKKKVHYCKH